ncbi:MAG: histidinol phosphate phosphatase [Alphaproteobacteria bacterium]|jgi:inositol-phosphate phosphatase / L-galactose 1-phosphate phosphatase / histidinol-phosphatase|nr:histidinol phosphate phosphatase [Alphaproteobacteria bacterium]MBT5827408.1 histidinol phosphate phosphatase [Alphaproteobacteria bacterium]
MTTKKKQNKVFLNDKLFAFAHNLADIAGSITKKYFRSHNIENFAKNDQSPVTIADTEIEAALREEIFNKYPEHGVCGEEFGNVEGISPYKWYIDPIDGTSSFISGLPVFTNLIALLYKNEPILGIINQPILNERYSGGEAYEASLNQVRIKARKVTEISEAILSTTSPYLLSKNGMKILDIIRAKTKFQKYGGVFCGPDSYQYAMLASGYIDIILEEGLKPHDFLALVPIIKASGAVITDWQGKEVNELSKGEVLACSNKALHRKILELI